MICISKCGFIGIVLVAAVALCAAGEETLEQLIARANSARIQDQPRVCVQVARKKVEVAAKAYQEGTSDIARQAINDVVTYSGKASDAAKQTGKKLKDTEISLRKMAEKLRDIKRTLVYEEQPLVEQAAQRLEEMRTELLSEMFAKKGKK